MPYLCPGGDNEEDSSDENRESGSLEYHHLNLLNIFVMYGPT